MQKETILKYTHIEDIGWIAEPENWSELKYSLHNEPRGVVKFDPSFSTEEVKREKAKAIMSMFA